MAAYSCRRPAVHGADRHDFDDAPQVECGHKDFKAGKFFHTCFRMEKGVFYQLAAHFFGMGSRFDRFFPWHICL